MKFKTLLLTGISAFAIGIFNGKGASAQVLLNCDPQFNFGEKVICDDTQNMRYTMRPNGTTNLNQGCVIDVTPHTVTQCQISSGAIAPVNNVRIEFLGGNNINLVGPSGGVRLQRRRMQLDGLGGQLAKMTFTPTEVTNTVTVNLAGRLRVTPAATLGTFTGSYQVRAEELP